VAKHHLVSLKTEEANQPKAEEKTFGKKGEM
jgi:hypothetical protein